MDTGENPQVESLFRSLAAHRRRLILDYLMDEARGRASFAELVDYVVEEETRSPATDREAIVTTLHHTHLPKLADEGLIDYDRENGAVTTTDGTRQTEPYLEFARNWLGETEAD